MLVNAQFPLMTVGSCRITFELKVPNVSCAMGVRPGEQRCWRWCGQGMHKWLDRVWGKL